jgi:hypothetical protein
MKLVAAAVLAAGSLCAPTPSARADTQCPYPGVGVLGVNVGGVYGGFCDYPTEINGSHWHCQAGGLHLGIGFAGTGVGDAGSLGAAQAGQGVGGLSCNWRCPDGVDAPAPNPPGAWQGHYLVPMSTSNWCKDHMVSNGFWSDPVLATEGLPPINEIPPQPGETPLPQPVPPPLPIPRPGEPLITPTVPPPPPEEPQP